MDMTLYLVQSISSWISTEYPVPSLLGISRSCFSFAGVNPSRSLLCLDSLVQTDLYSFVGDCNVEEVFVMTSMYILW